jgi:hypothetical protein
MLCAFRNVLHGVELQVWEIKDFLAILAFHQHKWLPPPDALYLPTLTGACNDMQVWKIEDFLAKWEGTCSTGTGSSSIPMAADPGKAAIALVLLKEIDSYRYAPCSTVCAALCVSPCCF